MITYLNNVFVGLYTRTPTFTSGTFFLPDQFVHDTQP